MEKLTPLEIRRQLFTAARCHDADRCLNLALLMLERDLFIGEKATRTGHEKFIPVSEFPGRCQCGCGEQIPVGDAIYWGKGVGQWKQEHYERP